MPSAGLNLSPSAEKALRERIAAKVGARAREIVTKLHSEILKRTAFNTGRTLGSWHGSAGSPVTFDIATQYPPGFFAWDPAAPHTNDVSVGQEAGRGGFERLSLKTTQSIPFERKPYQIFYISNGAALDSGADFAPGIQSDLPQGPGSRARAQEYGRIAHYNLFSSTGEHKVFDFEPRGTLAVQMAVLTVLRDYGRL